MHVYACVWFHVYFDVVICQPSGWWFVNVDDFHEGWVPATYLEPLYGSEDVSIQRLDTGEGEGERRGKGWGGIGMNTDRYSQLL